MARPNAEVQSKFLSKLTPAQQGIVQAAINNLSGKSQQQMQARLLPSVKPAAVANAGLHHAYAGIPAKPVPVAQNVGAAHKKHEETHVLSRTTSVQGEPNIFLTEALAARSELGSVASDAGHPLSGPEMKARDSKLQLHGHNPTVEGSDWISKLMSAEGISRQAAEARVEAHRKKQAMLLEQGWGDDHEGKEHHQRGHGKGEKNAAGHGPKSSKPHSDTHERKLAHHISAPKPGDSMMS